MCLILFLRIGWRRRPIDLPVPTWADIRTHSEKERTECWLLVHDFYLGDPLLEHSGCLPFILRLLFQLLFQNPTDPFDCWKIQHVNSSGKNNQVHNEIALTVFSQVLEQGGHFLQNLVQHVVTCHVDICIFIIELFMYTWVSAFLPIKIGRTLQCFHMPSYILDRHPLTLLEPLADLRQLQPGRLNVAESLVQGVVHLFFHAEHVSRQSVSLSRLEYFCKLTWHESFEM